jgi:hypothetical protein
MPSVATHIRIPSYRMAAGLPMPPRAYAAVPRQLSYFFPFFVAFALGKFSTAVMCNIDT